MVFVRHANATLCTYKFMCDGDNKTSAMKTDFTVVIICMYHWQDNPANLDKVLTKQAEELFDNKR